MATIPQEVSNVSTQVEGEVNTTISQRDISTIVSIAGGQTLIRGGLISERRSVSDTGIRFCGTSSWWGVSSPATATSGSRRS